MKPTKRRERVRWMLEAIRISRVRACRLADFPRAVWYRPSRARERSIFRRRLNELAPAHPDFGFQRLHVLLRREN